MSGRARIRTQASSEHTFLTSVLLCGCSHTSWLDGWMDGWMRGWMDGWMDEWMDGLVGR